MKKIIGLLVILMFGVNAFGQFAGNVLCDFFDEKPTVIKVIDEIKNWGYSNQYMDLYTYSFKVDNKIYVLSYDTSSSWNRYLTYVKGKRGDVIERNVYLFCVENNTWSLASDIIKTDFRKVDDQGIASYDYYYPKRKNFSDVIRNVKNGVGNGYVKKLDDGSVQILLISFTCSNNNSSDSKYYDYRWDIFILTPNSNGFYTVKKC